LNRMAGLDGSWFPVFERVENDTDAGTFESAWHFRQRSDVSSGFAGSGQVRSGTEAWNETPMPAVICAWVWQPVQSTRAGSLFSASAWQLLHVRALKSVRGFCRRGSPVTCEAWHCSQATKWVVLVASMTNAIPGASDWYPGVEPLP